MSQLLTFLLTLFTTCSMTLFALTSPASSCPIENLKLIVMRHGQSTHNIEDVYNSNPSHPNYNPSYLTEQGKKQALASAKKLQDDGFTNDNIAAIFISPLPRTKQTADVLVNATSISPDKIHEDSRLIEVQIGDLEGKPVIHEWKSSYAQDYNTETNEHVMHRIRDFYQDLLSQHLCGHVIVITHGIPAQKLIDLLSKHHEKLETGAALAFPLNPKED